MLRLTAKSMATLSVLAQSRHAKAEFDDKCGVSYSTEQELTNWSSTHSASPKRLYEPKSSQEVVRVLQHFHDMKKKLRPVGTALSPNGIGMSDSDEDCMISVANLDHISVDKEAMTCTVGAGITVSSLLAELKKHDMTLENFSSIQEQQMGGWTQVSAHGTGISLPPVDEMIVNMQIATPTEGLLSLSERKQSSVHPFVSRDLFRMCKVGLGGLGVVTELTLKCIPSLDLVEHTNIKTRKTISCGHRDRLGKYRHVRYMWVPYSDTVVQITTNPLPAGVHEASITAHPQGMAEEKAAATSELCSLLLSLKPEKDPSAVSKLSFSQLRDELLDISPLDVELVKRINRAEAAFWASNAGVRIDDSTNILGFDCGGEQWVYEVCFPIGSLEQQPKEGCSSGKDVEFVKKLLAIIEENGIAAPSPIEQRWTARSTAPMSPAYSENPDDIFSWVGVIMYLPPSQTPAQRADITRAFWNYTSKLAPLFEEYGAHAHWAKIELPSSSRTPEEAAASGNDVINPRLDKLRQRVRERYDVEGYNSYRRALDPHFVLGNELMQTLFEPGRGSNAPAMDKKTLLERRKREKT